MAFTMHSHSGQFCPGHAKDDLEQVIQHAISIGYKTIGLTEHMPRYSVDDLYPEEVKDKKKQYSQLEPTPEASLAALPPRHLAYLAEASRLQAKYADRVHILIAFEGEFIRPSYAADILRLSDPSAYPQVDYFIGSLHHVRGVPIDYDRPTYARARDLVVSEAAPAAAGCEKHPEEAMYEAYYDEQYDMLTALKPRIVGHFDLIRLMSDLPGRDVRSWKGVWERIVRNLRTVVDNGGWLECNTSALRKGLDEPYPCRVIAEEYLALGGKFTFSDDSHGIAQVATNYVRGLDYLESLGVTELWTFERNPHPGVQAGAKATLTEKSVLISAFRESLKV
ncbi:hypothetical protein jhhlp_003541 [Lomentospora prolificans]|uniref:Histidinol-phosphatase n=1 Tax=Lomentospora prolificans TaxID=41688 RepID=A0A2N3N911_9PEZI|nr:hypothetical protein jhhlp_003541 [Lomentospora prolificans]